MSNNLKYSIQRLLPDTIGHAAGSVWSDCQNGSPHRRGYAAHEEAKLLSDMADLTEKYPNETYRIVHHVEFVPATKARLAPR